MGDRRQPLHFREYAGVLTAFLVVMAFVGIGFAQGLAHFLTGQDIPVSEAWSSAMLSLASAALGFLIGKQIGPDTAPQPPVGAVLPPVATTLPATPTTPLPLPPAPGNVPQ